MISPEMTLAQLLARYPDLLEVLGRRQPRLANLLAKPAAARLTVAEAAGAAGMAPEDFMADLRKALGDKATAPMEPGPACGPTFRSAASAHPRPPHLDAVSAAQRVELDVREDIRAGREPFGRIMAAARGLGDDQVLVLRAPFEPVPLFEILEKRGLAHWSDCHAPGDWSVWFYRPPSHSPALPAPGTPGPGAEPENRMLSVDVRGLEPPLPMARVLAMLEELEPGQRLEVLHERRPVFLYPQIEERGFFHETDEPQPGMVRIVIRRPPER